MLRDKAIGIKTTTDLRCETLQAGALTSLQLKELDQVCRLTGCGGNVELALLVHQQEASIVCVGEQGCNCPPIDRRARFTSNSDTSVSANEASALTSGRSVSAMMRR